MRRWKKPAAACLAALLTVTVLPYAGGGTIVTCAAGNNLAKNGGFEGGDLTGWTQNSWCTSGGSHIKRCAVRRCDKACGRKLFSEAGRKDKRSSNPADGGSGGRTDILAVRTDLSEYREYAFCRIHGK